MVWFVLGLSKEITQLMSLQDFTETFNNMRTRKIKAQPTNAFFTTSIKCSRLLPVSGYCRAHSNQIVEHISDNETMLGSSRNGGGAAEHLIDGSEKWICRSILESACDNNYNLLKLDWCINCVILLWLNCKVVIGQLGVIGQLHEPIKNFKSSLLNPPITTLITTTVVTSSRDWLCKIVEV